MFLKYMFKSLFSDYNYPIILLCRCVNFGYPDPHSEIWIRIKGWKVNANPDAGEKIDADSVTEAKMNANPDPGEKMNANSDPGAKINAVPDPEAKYLD